MDDLIESPPRTPMTGFRVAHGVLKALTILAGLGLTILSLMASIGALTDNIWIRLVPSVIVALVGPLVLVDRLLPESDQQKAKGLPTDVLALMWFGFAVIFIGVAGPLTRGILVDEADRLREGGVPVVPEMTYWMAGARPVVRPPATAEEPRPPSEGDAGPPDAGPAPATRDGGGPDAPEGGDSSSAPSDADAGPPDAGGEEPPRTEMTPAELFRKLAPSVVTISVRGPHGTGGGTGFFIDRDGTIATNHHVIEGAKAVGVKLFDGSWATETELLVEHADMDLALLRVKAAGRVLPISLADSDEVTVGEGVVCIGNPLGLEHTLTDGLVSARRMWKGRRMVQISAPVSPGNSGGPVANMRGEVVGVATMTLGAGFGRGQNLNLAVPANSIKALIKADYPDRRRLEPTDTTGPNRW